MSNTTDYSIYLVHGIYVSNTTDYSIYLVHGIYVSNTTDHLYAINHLGQESTVEVIINKLHII